MSTVSSAIRILQKEKDRLTKELHGVAAALAAFGKTYAKGTTRRRLSAVARERIAAAQRKRWAKRRTSAATPSTIGQTRWKRTLSAAARKKIAAAQRAKWAKVKAGKKTA